MLDLEPIRARLTLATPGPYEWDGEGGMITHDTTRVAETERLRSWVGWLCGANGPIHGLIPETFTRHVLDGATPFVSPPIQDPQRPQEGPTNAGV